jgi:tetratricopeptide (TPR) repeat protein
MNVLLPEFLPKVFTGHLLLTTRAQALAGMAHPIALTPLSLDAGVQFVLRRSGLLAPDQSVEAVAEQVREDAARVAEMLGGLPLALDQAGAYIEETQCGVSDYLQRYQMYRTTLLARRGGKTPDHPQAVATTWALSFEKVKAANSQAAELLRRCAFLHPDAIPEELFLPQNHDLGDEWQMMTEPDLDEAIAQLRSYSLIQRDAASHTLILHRLVQAVLQASLSEAEQRLRRKQAISALGTLFPTGEHEHWPQCERLLPHALMYMNDLLQGHDSFSQAFQLLSNTGWYLYERARYSEAQPLFERALAIREQQLGPIHPDTAYSLNDLAMLYQDQGKDEQAEPLLERALAIREQQLGPIHPHIATTRWGLAALAWKQGKLGDARAQYEQVLTVFQQTFEPEHPQTIQLRAQYERLLREMKT